MNDMLTFITKYMKRKDKMVMQDLMDASKMSRAKFYKCLKEPIRFSDDELEAISNKLNLGDNERDALFAYKNFSEPESTQKRSLAYTEIERTVFGRSDIVTDQNAMIFKVFSPEIGEPVANVMSSDILAAKFDARVADLGTGGKKLPLEILIFNAHQEEKVHVLYALLHSLSRQSNVKKAHEISIRHFLAEGKAEEKDDERTAGRKVQYYAKLLPLAAYGNYSINFSQQVRNVFFGTTDSVFIRYKGKGGAEGVVDRYLVMNIINKSDVSVYSFSDSSLNAFFAHNFSDLLTGTQKRSWLPSDAITVNAQLVELFEQSPKILITTEPCFDSMIADIWDDAEAYIRENMYASSKREPSRKLIEALRESVDPAGQSAICTDPQFVGTLFNQFRRRFELSEGNNAINLIAPAGLKRFAETCATTEMMPAEYVLPLELVIKELKYIRDGLGKMGSANGQSFYLINPMKKSLDKAMMIFRDKLIAYLFYHNGVPDTNWQSVNDPEVTDLFYSYIVEELLPDAKRSTSDSLIMGDSWSREFLDGLIADINRRMKEPD